MKSSMTLLALGLLGACVTPLMANRNAFHKWDDDLAVQEKEEVQRSFPLTGAGPWRLSIDNMIGSIGVASSDQQSVELAVTKTIAARSADMIETARKEVSLKIDESGSGVDLYVDGPFRCNCNNGSCGSGGNGVNGNGCSGNGCVGRDCSDGCRNGDCWNKTRNWDRNYRVRYDFVLKVPRSIALCLRTVVDGDIRVEGAAGEFDVSNVNGAIEMLDVSGSGRARTINRDVRVVFARNPSAPSSFATINGNTIIYFKPALAANLRVKTFNGKIYTDFDTDHLAALAPVAERRDGKFIYKSDRGVGLKVGLGGPELRFETLNGDIRILQRD
jgi:hypothetical protein